MKPHLLPMHYRLGRLLGMRPEDVKRFYWEAARKASSAPQPAIVAGTGLEVLGVVSLVASAISVGLTIVAQFLKPDEVQPGRLRAMNREGRTINDARRYAPRDGFDSLQEPATIGQPMPMVFALKETINGVTYGGIRVNCSLLWSQLQTVNGQQLLRTIFLIADGGIDSVDTNGFALGNNLINAYNLGSGTELGSSYAVYLRPDGGRILSTDYVAGRSAALDPGNAQNYGGQDVFAVRSINRAWKRDFCSVTKPSSNTVFGLYSPIGNNLGYRVSPVIRSKWQAQLVPKGEDGDGKVVCQIDEVAAAQRKKSKTVFSTRSGLIAGSANAVGDTLTYILDKSSDVETDYGKAFDPGSWDIDVTVERLSGSGTNSVDYDSTSSTTYVSVNQPSLPNDASPLIAGIQWLNELDQVVANPVVIITNVSDRKVQLGVKVQYNSSGLTQEQKRALFYSRFKLTFFNDSVEDADEPSVYYRVPVEQKAAVQTNYSVNFNAQTFSANNETQQVVYTVATTLDSRRTLTTRINRGELYSELAADVASVIAGKQEQWDDAIQIGSLYKIGTALAVCTGRSPEGEVFYSESAFSNPGLQTPPPGQSITATFTVVRPGLVTLTFLSDLLVDGNAEPQPKRYVGTTSTHIFRISIATITTNRPTRLIEIVIRSNLGIRINGLCNFRDTISYNEADNRSCLDYKGDIVSAGSTLKQYNYTSGSITASQIRYSFYRIRTRVSGSNGAWIEFPEYYGFRGVSQQNQFNTIRMQFPSVAQWEVEFEPVTGWEIRKACIQWNFYEAGSVQQPADDINRPSSVQSPTQNFIVASFQPEPTSTFVLIDDKQTATSNLITRTYQSTNIYVYGRYGAPEDVGIVDSEDDPFRLPAVRREPGQDYGNLGYGYTDGRQFVDVYGALSETFCFSEVTSTAEGGPEHEIVSVTEIIENDTVPLYSGLAISGLNLLPGNTFRQLGQFSCYVNGGYPEARRLRNGMTPGPTHLFPDVALELLTNPIYGSGDSVSDDQIDIDSFREAANWCYANRYFYDAIFMPTPTKEWIAEVAEQHLLHFHEVDGRFTLTPMFPYVDGDYTDWTKPVEIKGVFGLLQMKSFSFSAIEEEARRSVQVSGKWREERKATDITNPGIFPSEREVLIREAGSLSSETDPVDSFDLSGFATNEKHLVDYLKMKARSKRLSTHGITIELTLESLLSPIKPGDYIQVPVEMTYFNEFSTGIIDSAGLLTSVYDIAPGTYNAITWTGLIEDEVTESEITVLADGTASPQGIIFVIKHSSSDYKTYRITDIDPTENGGFTVNAIETPIDSNGRLILCQNWGGTTTDSNWVIKK